MNEDGKRYGEMKGLKYLFLHSSRLLMTVSHHPEVTPYLSTLANYPSGLLTNATVQRKKKAGRLNQSNDPDNGRA